jgi:hypothetical protein
VGAGWGQSTGIAKKTENMPTSSPLHGATPLPALHNAQSSEFLCKKYTVLRQSRVEQKVGRCASEKKRTTIAAGVVWYETGQKWDIATKGQMLHVRILIIYIWT